MPRADDDEAKRAKRARLLKALMRLDEDEMDDEEAKKADDDTDLDDEEADEDDLGGAPSGKGRAKKARRAKKAKRTDDDEARQADDDELDDDTDLEDDDTTMRRARRTFDSFDSEDGAWDDPSMSRYEKNSRQAIPRVGPNDDAVHGRSQAIGFPNKVVVHGREVSVADRRLAIHAQRVARREGLNFRDPASRLMAYMLAEKESGYRGPDI